MIDCIPFFKDFDLLEIRLNSLAPYMEQFVVLESPLTLGNQPKPLFFHENRERFKGFNIRYLVYEPPRNYRRMSGMNRAWSQLRYLVAKLDVSPETMIFISDGDEIPNLKVWNGGEGAFQMERYYYRLDGYYKRNDWLGTDAILKKTLNKYDIEQIRFHRRENRHLWAKNVFDGGWHFCCLGSIEDVLYKYASNGHQEIVRPEIFEKIRENYENRRHPLHLAMPPEYQKRPHNRPRRLRVWGPSGPDWLLENKERYKHLFYGEDKKT